MIEVTPDPDGEAVEHCCFCRARTKFFYRPKDVACCKGCATMSNPDDVPTKKVGWRREQIARDIGSPTVCGGVKTERGKP